MEVTSVSVALSATQPTTTPTAKNFGEHTLLEPLIRNRRELGSRAVADAVRVAARRSSLGQARYVRL